VDARVAECGRPFGTFDGPEAEMRYCGARLEIGRRCHNMAAEAVIRIRRSIGLILNDLERAAEVPARAEEVPKLVEAGRFFRRAEREWPAAWGQYLEGCDDWDREVVGICRDAATSDDPAGWKRRYIRRLLADAVTPR
jgi:hypothetical protein